MHGLFVRIMGATRDPQAQDSALRDLLQRLKALDYRFTAVTPATHQRVLAKAGSVPPSLRDIFGWNRPFAPGDLDPALEHLLRTAEALSSSPDGLRSKVRVAGLGPDLFLHSGFPTTEADSVFFGPDTYRFAAFIAEETAKLERPTRIVDMGTGSGAGGLWCARLIPDASLLLVDVNARALRLARINAAAAGLRASFSLSEDVPEGADLVVANPPYIIDPLRRVYRDGGSFLGGEVAVTWVRQSLAALNAGGTMLLYFGAAFAGGGAPALDAIAAECRARGAEFSCREIDSDVFGEELENEAYQDVERIAAVGCVIRSV